MADLFLSYARADGEKVARIAEAMEASGRSLWWDRRLGNGEDYGLAIERELSAAGCVLVTWSKSARDSLWVRAEANAALDEGKLVQVTLDGSKLPLPFTMLHYLDLSHWAGERGRVPWPHLEREVGVRLGDAEPNGRHVPKGMPLLAGPSPALQGFGKAAALGWIALATTMLLCLSIIFVSRHLIPADAFAAISMVALGLGVATTLLSGLILARVMKASRT